MGVKILVAYVVIMVVVVIVGLVVVNLFQLGDYIDEGQWVKNWFKYELWVESIFGGCILDGECYFFKLEYVDFVAEVEVVMKIEMSDEGVEVWMKVVE